MARLDPDDPYDVVLVILPKHRTAEVLAVLAANHRTPSVMFFGNNAAGPGAMTDAIGRDRVLLPGNHRVFEWLPESFLLFLMRRMVKSETTAIKLGHAAQGRAEWQVLADEFRSLIERVDVPTPSIDVAYRHLSPASAAAE